MVLGRARENKEKKNHSVTMQISYQHNCFTNAISKIIKHMGYPIQPSKEHHIYIRVWMQGLLQPPTI